MSLFFWFVRCTRAELEKEKFVQIQLYYRGPRAPAQLDQVGERRSWLPLLRDNHVGLLGQNACNDSLPPSLSEASATADAVAGAGGGRGAAGAGGSSQNSGGASEVFKCGECGECVCECQDLLDLLDSNPTTSSSVSRYPPASG